MAAHERNDAARRIGRGFKILAPPLHQRGLHLLALRLAAEHLADGVAMMRKVGVAADEAVVAGLVNAGNGVPGRRRRLVVDAQIALGAAFGDGVAHVDGDILRLSAAQPPDLGGGQACGSDRGLAGNCDTK